MLASLFCSALVQPLTHVTPWNGELDLLPGLFLQDRCPKWAKGDECTTNAGWMNTNCRRSCGSCTNVQSFTQARPGPKTSVMEAAACCNSWHCHVASSQYWLCKGC